MIQMTVGQWGMFALCLAGISYQLVSGGEAEGGFSRAGADRASGAVPVGRFGERDLAVVRSSRKREKSVKKAYFPFDSLSMGGVLQSSNPSQAELFLRTDHVARRAYSERIEANLRINMFRELGLGIKHPKVEPFQARKEESENTVILRWLEYRKRDPRGKARERKRAPGG
jgi:hypothetical protein|tara:strand:- start:1590 stop:2102 length:513 start_codon:yes stop_codon:yes gene_type:complete